MTKKVGDYLKRRIDAKPDEGSWKKVTESEADMNLVASFPRTTGLVERSFFVVVVGLLGPVAAGIAGPLFIAKMAVSWNRINSSQPYIRMHAQRGLMLSMISFGFGLVGGWIATTDLVARIAKTYGWFGQI